MRIAPMLLAAVAAAALFTACGGSSRARPSASTYTAAPAAANSSTPVATRPIARTVTPGAVAPAATAASGEQVEVTGIVGTVAAGTRTLQITRLSGAPVGRVEMLESTVIRRAGDGRAGFGDIHISDRIVADGRLNDRGDTLLADDITIQAVAPGAAPGGLRRPSERAEEARR